MATIIKEQSTIRHFNKVRVNYSGTARKAHGRLSPGKTPAQRLREQAFADPRVAKR